MPANSADHTGADLLSGRIRVVDLTANSVAEFPQIVLPPEFGHVLAVSNREISR